LRAQFVPVRAFLVLALVCAVTAPMIAQNASAATTTIKKSSQATVLTVNVKGKITTFNVQQIAALHSKKAKVFDPFTKKVRSFTVIDLSRIFNKVGIEGNDLISMQALDDYEYSDKASQFIIADALVAFEDNAKQIAVTKGGPIRLIFPKGSNYEKLVDSWVWSLSKITVK